VRALLQRLVDAKGTPAAIHDSPYEHDRGNSSVSSDELHSSRFTPAEEGIEP
jgi:hypothetical protein